MPLPYKLVNKACMPDARHFTLKMVFLCISSISLIAVSILLGKITWKKWMKHYQLSQSSSLAGLIIYLVAIQCMIDIAYFICDLTFVLDCNGPPLIKLFNQSITDPSIITNANTLIYIIVKEGILLLSCLWHATISYNLYAWVVLKRSACRLHNRWRIPCLCMFAALVTIGRYLLFIYHGKEGVFIGKLLSDGLLVPLCLVFLQYWYIKTVWTLYGPYGSQIKEQAILDELDRTEERKKTRGSSEEEEDEEGKEMMMRTISGKVAVIPERGGHHSSDVELKRMEEGDTVKDDLAGRARGASLVFPFLPSPLRLSKNSRSSTVSNVVDAEFSRNRHLIRRLIRICITITLVRVITVSLDLSIWCQFYDANTQMPADGLIITYAVLHRLWGLVDAIILGTDVSLACFWSSSSSLSAALPSRLAMPLIHRLRSNSMDSPRCSVDGKPAKNDPTSIAQGALSKENLQLEVLELQESIELINLQKAQDRQLKKVQIFASTWNMGGIERDEIPDGAGGPLERVLPTWIPQGYDMYVIGVQECICVNKLRDDIQAYLGGPEAYTMYGAEIGGNKLVNGCIALTIMVRASEVAQGAFKVHEGSLHKVAAGVPLGPIGRASNKGMSGLSLRYHDVSIAIINCHFAADSRGRNRLAKRNEDAAMALRELSLTWDSGQIDVHHQHMHTILLGDLNYRIQGNPEDILCRISRSARASRSLTQAIGLGGRYGYAALANWRLFNYAKLFHLGTESQTSCYQPRHLEVLSQQQSSSPSTCMGQGSCGRQSENDSSSRCCTPLVWREISDISNLTFDPSSPFSLKSGGSCNMPSPRMRPSLSRMQTTRRSSFISTEVIDEEEVSIPSRESSFISFDGDEDEGKSFPLSPVRGSIQTVPLQALSAPSWPVSSPADIWAWVPELDELTQCMRDHLILSGFREHPITFPPSYRWQRGPASSSPKYHDGDVGDLLHKPIGGLAGDFTDMILLRTSYTTLVKNAIPTFAPTSFWSSNGSLPPLAPDGNYQGSSGVYLESPSSQSCASSSPISMPSSSSSVSQRTPSYTDRILIHSLPGKAPYLHIKNYDMADENELSDHRPVSAALELLVDQDVQGFEVGNSESKNDGGDMAVFTFTIIRPCLQLVNAQAKPYDTVVVFPLMPEDPFAKERMESSLSEAISGGVGGGQGGQNLEQADHQQGISSSCRTRDIKWSDYPSRFQMVASRRFSEHMAIKIKDAEGNDLGQACLPVMLGVREEAPLSASQAQVSSGCESVLPPSCCPRDSSSSMRRIAVSCCPPSSSVAPPASSSSRPCEPLAGGSSIGRHLTSSAPALPCCPPPVASCPASSVCCGPSSSAQPSSCRTEDKQCKTTNGTSCSCRALVDPNCNCGCCRSQSLSSSPPRQPFRLASVETSSTINRSKRVKLCLTSGGRFRGWLSLELRVTIQNMMPSSSSSARTTSV